MTFFIRLAPLLVGSLFLLSCASRPEAPRAPALTLASLGATSRIEIDPSDRPDAPKGFTDRFVYSLAELMTEIVSASFSKEVMAVKGTDAKLTRVMKPMKARYPEAIPAMLEAANEQLAPHPWKRILADDFGAGSRPNARATILKVVWDTQVDRSDPDPALTISLQVHAAYQVGTAKHPRIIGVRRTLTLITGGPSTWPGIGAGLNTYGADECKEAIDGVLVSSRDQDEIASSRALLKEELADKGFIEETGGDRADIEKAVDSCKKRERAS